MVSSLSWWRPETWPLPKMLPGVWSPLAGAPYLLVGLNLVIALVLLFFWGSAAWTTVSAWWSYIRPRVAQWASLPVSGYLRTEGAGGLWFILTAVSVLHWIALVATLTTWSVPGGRQVPRHASDWILAFVIPLASAIWLAMARDPAPESYNGFRPVAPMDGWVSPPRRRRRIRQWLLAQGRHVGVSLGLLVWVCLTSRTGHVVRADPRVYAEPGWVLLLGLTLVVLGFHVRALWAERVGSPSWGWIRWAFGGPLPADAGGPIVSKAVDVLIAEGDGVGGMGAPNWRSWHGAFLEQTGLSGSSIAWAWLHLIVVTPDALPVTMVRPLLLHRDPDIRLRAIQLLGQRTRSGPQSDSAGSSPQEIERGPVSGASA